MRWRLASQSRIPRAYAGLVGEAIELELHEHKQAVEARLVGQQVRAGLKPAADGLHHPLQTAAGDGMDAPVGLFWTRAPALGDERLDDLELAVYRQQLETVDL